MAETENQEVLDDAQRAMQEACGKYLSEGERVVRWAVTIEVEREEDRAAYLAHRAGGGEDGTTEPPPWYVLALAEALSMTMKNIMGSGLPPA